MVHEHLHLILGGPGTGKTTRLLQIVEQELARGVMPQEIAFVTFTRVAAAEARERALQQFSGVMREDSDAPWFRTLHSLAYLQLSVERDDMMSLRDWRAFAEESGEDLSTVTPSHERDEFGIATSLYSARHTGDLMMMAHDYAATTGMSIHDAMSVLGINVDGARMRRFVMAFRAFKADVGKKDFTDLLQAYADHGDPVPVRVAIIDEAQDLTALQWRVASRAFQGAERVYVGGDDDQAIYQWAGADVARFLALSASPEVLPTSYRLPRTVHALAQRVAGKISQRYHKTFASADREGTVTHHWSIDGVPLEGDAGTWFLLARNSYMLARLESAVRRLGFAYSTRKGTSVNAEHVAMMLLWERLRRGQVKHCSAKMARALLKMLGLPVPMMRELVDHTLDDLGVPHAQQRLPWFEAFNGLTRASRDYYQAILRRGEDIKATPRFHIETIHGVKGAQADNVVLVTDISKSAFTTHWKMPDAEHRIFYVGMTRARHNLHIIAPSTDMFYRV